MFERDKLPVPVRYAKSDGNFLEFTGLSDKLVFERTGQNIKGRLFDIKSGQHLVEKELARLPNPHGVHSEVDVADRICIGVGGDK